MFQYFLTRCYAGRKADSTLSSAVFTIFIMETILLRLNVSSMIFGAVFGLGVRIFAAGFRTVGFSVRMTVFCIGCFV